MKPFISKRKCPAQQSICQPIQVCPNGAIQYVADEDEPLGGRIVFDHDRCQECGQCVTACCGQAIEMR